MPLFMKFSLLALLLSMLFAHTASAHTFGHSEGVFETAVHFLTQPDHLTIAAFSLASIAIAVTTLGKRRADRKQTARVRVDTRS